VHVAYSLVVLIVAAEEAIATAYGRHGSGAILIGAYSIKQ